MAAEYKLEGFRTQEEQCIAKARLTEGTALSRQPEKAYSFIVKVQVV